MAVYFAAPMGLESSEPEMTDAFLRYRGLIRPRRQEPENIDHRFTGKPGSRRFRRYLNSTMSDHDSSATEASDDEEVPMWAPKWEAQFQQVGYDFFESTERELRIGGRRRPIDVNNISIEEFRGWRYMCMDRRVRTLLRSVGRDSQPFLEELESILIPFKHRSGFDSQSVSGFTLLNSVVTASTETPHTQAPNSKTHRARRSRRSHTDRARARNKPEGEGEENQAEEQDDDEEQEKDDKHKHKSKHKDKDKEREEKGRSIGQLTIRKDKDTLICVFPDSMLRLIAHGAAAFHGLYSKSGTSTTGGRFTVIKRLRGSAAKAARKYHVTLVEVLMIKYPRKFRLRGERSPSPPPVGARGRRGAAHDDDDDDDDDDG